MSYITTYIQVPSTPWSMSARTLSPFAPGKYFEFLVGLNSSAIFAVGPAGMDGLSPDYFQNRLEIINGVVNVVDGGDHPITLTGALPASDGSTQYRVKFRLSAAYSGREIQPQFLAPTTVAAVSRWQQSVLGEPQFVYMWVENSGDTVYASDPFIGDASDLLVTHELTGSTRIKVTTSAVLRVGTAIILGGATKIQVYTSLARIIPATNTKISVTTKLNLSGGYLRAQLVDFHAADSRAGIAKLVAPNFILSGALTQRVTVIVQPSGGVLTTLPMYVTKAWMFSGQSASIAIASQPISGAGGDYVYGFGRLVASPCAFRAGEVDGVGLSAYPVCYDFWQFTVPQLIALSESPSAQTDMYFGAALQPSESASVVDTYGFAYTGTVVGAEQASAVDYYQFTKVGKPATADSNGSETWCLNIDTSASSVYTNFQFNSYFKLDGVQYGVADDGVYQLDGDTDGGLLIESKLHLGTTDFQVNRDKYVSKVYIGGSSTSKLNVAVNADGVTRQYAARISAVETDVCRVDLGSGVRANYWGFTILNTAGGDFALDNVRVAPVLTLRRI